MTEGTMGLAEHSSAYVPIFVARQPIFDRDQNVWGYELFFRDSELAKTAHITDPETATAQVIADGFSLAKSGIDPDKRLFLNVSPKHLLKGSIEALPKEVCVVDLSFRKSDPEIVEACLALKEKGFSIALELPAPKSLVKLADIIRLNISRGKTSNIMKVVSQLQSYQCQLLAEKIEDKATHQKARAFGFSLFQGYHFSKPTVMHGKKISTGPTAKLQLINELSSPDYEVKKLTRLISTDPSLSYRLLQFINSAYFSLHKKITSVTQAITLLGQRPLKQWLMVVMLSDLDTDPKSNELFFLSVQRGRFLELLAEKMSPPPLSQDTMLLLGLFSKLDALLDQNMSDVTESLPLEEDIKAALNGLDSPGCKWIKLAECVEEAKWEEVESFLEGHGLKPKDAAISYNIATLWAYELTQNAQENAA